MKKLLLATLIASSFTASVFASSKTTTVIMDDKSLSEAVVVLNVLCESSVDINEFKYPDKRISLNFDELECAEAIKLVESFDYPKKS